MKSKRYKCEEAAATYLKIIAEARVRFPEHQETVLNSSDIRIREALFIKDAIEALTPTERDVFGRITSGQELSDQDKDYFYYLMGGLKDLPDEEHAIVDHFAKEFKNNYAFYQFVKWMAGEGDLYLNYRVRHGYPCDVLALHATVPLTAEGELAEFDGKYGRDALLHLKDRIQLGLEAWRQLLEHDDSSLLQMHQDDIKILGLLPWDRRSPLYARQMQTAARAVLDEKTGT
ncbi:fructose-bisphosphatase class III [Candidatus Saganbacteria bacterium]|nr:fructose-bisphosphatase class III [Candidatus Saganbacteria bacterium]